MATDEENRDLRQMLERLPKLCCDVISQSPVSTWIAGTDGTLLYQNQANKERFGIESDEEVVGKYNIFKDEEVVRRGLAPQIRKVFEEGGSTEFIIDYDFSRVSHIRPARPTHRILRVFFFAITEAGRVKYVVVQHEDYTEKRRIEESLAESEAKYRDLVENISDWVWEVNIQGRYTYSNPSVHKILGYTPEQILGKSAFDFIMPEDHKEMREAIESAASTGTDFHSLVHRMCKKDGSVRTIESSGRPINDPQGNVVGFRGIDRDITERIEAEERLRASEAEVSALLNAIPDVIFVLDREGRYIRIAPPNPHLLYRPSEELLGKTLHEVFAKEKADSFLSSVRRALDTHETIHMEYALKIDGSEVWFATAIAPMTEDSVVCVARDVTERKHTDEKLAYQASFQQVLTELATEFINLPSDQIDSGITLALQAAGEFVGADRSFVFLADDEIKTISNTHEWHREGVESQIERLQGLPITEFALMAERIENPEVVNISRVQDMPPEYAKEKALLEIQHVKSFIALPLLSDVKPIGFLGFVTVREENSWPEETITLMRVVGEILVNTLSRKHAEEEVKRSEARFRTIFESTPALILTYDEHAVVHQVNQAFVDFTGFTREQLVDRQIFETFAKPDIAEKKAGLMEQVFSGETVRNVEWEAVRADGSAVYALVDTTPLYDHEGHVQYALAIGIDITKRKQAQAALKESEERFRLVAETATDAIIMIDEESTALFVNPAAERIFGHSMKDMLGQKITMLMPEALREKHLRGIKTHIQTGEKHLQWRNVELPGLHREGRIIPLEISYAEFIKEGKHYFTGIIRDITERRLAQEAIRRSEENYRSIFNYTPAGMIAFDREARILQANAATERMVGFTKEQMVGKSVFDTFARNQEKSQTEQAILRVFAGEVIEGMEWEVTTADNRTICVITNLTPVYDSAGGITMGVALGLDITERKAAEQARRELDEHKKEFYRRTILAATEGKLVVTERDEIERISGPPIAAWSIKKGEDLSEIRHELGNFAQARGMEEDRICDFVLAIGEATTNAYKHAGGGEVAIHEVPEGLMVTVTDQGSGMEALTLPEVALVRGYSTAGSLGMGYKAMISVADKLYLATGPSGTIVGIVMRVHPVEQKITPVSLPDTWR